MSDEDFRVNADMKAIYKMEDIDLNFRKELSEKVGAKSLLQCIQCGVCSSGCTVSEYIDLQPHRVVASCLLGLKELVLNSNAIWICSLCHQCTERCPKHVDYSFLLALLRNMAVENGKIPGDFINVLNNFSEGGLAVPFNEFIQKSTEKRRERMDLPKMPQPNIDQINEIIRLCGLDVILDKKTMGEDA